MKKFLKLITLISILTILTSCSSNANSTGANSSTAKDSSSNLGKGQAMSLRFETNPSTGFDWEFAALIGDEYGLIELNNQEYEDSSDGELMGAGGYSTYRFIARKKGPQRLTFTYERPWEGGEKLYNVLYELDIDDDLNITCLEKRKGDIESDKKLSDFPDPTFE